MAASTGSGSILVISPHLDDAVFSCGAWIAHHPGAVIATIFAGVPPGFGYLTAWDARSGFRNAEEAIAGRRAEDREAAAVLAAIPRWLEFFDSQYESPPSGDELVATLEDLLRGEQPDMVLIPAGLFHSDHVLAHQVALSMLPKYPDKNWLMYEDALYRRFPGLLQQRLAGLLRASIHATPFDVGSNPSQAQDAALKRRAVACYASQLKALARSFNACADIYAPERLWHLDVALPQAPS